MKDGSRLTDNGSERRRKYEVSHWALKGDHSSELQRQRNNSGK